MKPVNKTVFLAFFITQAILSVSYATDSEKTSFEDVQKETSDLIDAISTYSVDKRDEAIEASKKALENIDERIEQMEARLASEWENMDGAAREQAQEVMSSLRKQRVVAAEWYGSFKNSAADSWQNMKEGFSKALKDLERAWEKSEKEFSDTDDDTTDKN